MCGVLIELPDKLCELNDSEQFRCNLSFYIQLVCIFSIASLMLIKALRLVGIDYFKCTVDMLTFLCAILCITGPYVVLRYVKALRCLRLLLIVR